MGIFFKANNPSSKRRQDKEGIDFALGKVERSWNKLIPEARELVQEQYEAIKQVFE